jgi:hypothetical protein
VRRVDNLATILCILYRISGSRSVLEPSRPVQRLLSLLHTAVKTGYTHIDGISHKDGEILKHGV